MSSALAVIKGDSFGLNMASLDDLRQAIHTAVTHLKPGGVFLLVAKTEETFQNNNFAYTGEKDGVRVTLVENNHIDPFLPNSYEVTFVYLIRQKGELTICTDHQVLGLFPQATWGQVINDAKLTMQKTILNGIYDKYLLGDGDYPLTVFVGQKA